VSATWIAVIVGYVVVMICNFTAMQSVAMMADQVNVQRKGKEPLSPFGWQRGWQRQREIVREYRSMHPRGMLYHRMIGAYLIGAIALAVIIISVFEQVVAGS
jgi:hypothetical protein